MRFRIRCGSLVALTSVIGCPIDTARGGIDKTRHAGLLACPRQRDGPKVVDLVGRMFAQLTEWIVRQFCKMNDRVEPLKILAGNPSHVFSESKRTWAVVVVKPAFTVKATIYPDDVKPRSTSLGPRTAPIYPSIPVTNIRIVTIPALLKIYCGDLGKLHCI